jgi:hypothetical protein
MSEITDMHLPHVRLALFLLPIPVAMRASLLVCCHLMAWITGLNLAEGMDIRVL